MSTKSNEGSSVLQYISITKVATRVMTISLIFAIFNGLVAAQTVEDSASVYKFVEEYQQTINTHDPGALAAFFTEDADLMMFNLPGVHGRQAIEKWWRDVWHSKFNRQEPGRKGTIIPNSVRFLASDVALVNIETRTGGKDSMGVELHTRKARGTWLLHRQNGNWLISALCGMPTEKDSVELIRSLKASESLKPQIHAFVSAYEEAFDTHDPAAISAFYTNDADIVVRNSPLIHGRSAILKWWRAYFAKLRPQSLDRNRWFESMRTILIINKIRMITHDIALINITGTGAARQADTEPPPIRYARATWIIVREKGEWLIASLRVLPSEEDRVIRR
jgi:uncharacterized protein (TIGR02246 family)